MFAFPAQEDGKDQGKVNASTLREADQAKVGIRHPNAFITSFGWEGFGGLGRVQFSILDGDELGSLQLAMLLHELLPVVHVVLQVVLELLGDLGLDEVAVGIQQRIHQLLQKELLTCGGRVLVSVHHGHDRHPEGHLLITLQEEFLLQRNHEVLVNGPVPAAMSKVSHVYKGLQQHSSVSLRLLLSLPIIFCFCVEGIIFLLGHPCCETINKLKMFGHVCCQDGNNNLGSHVLVVVVREVLQHARILHCESLEDERGVHVLQR
mmetsp:Transcript_69440/g.151645  ORF Transcript_69440/g.151645 Transcript_69440/m.151645 type:complete len:263 (+) Transcript_69440:274-1062(+)